MRRKAVETSPAGNPYESSFRPNTGARFVKEPVVPPPVHTRTSSMTSSLSSASEQSANARRASPYSTPEPITARAEVHREKPRDMPEPEPDYNDPEPDYDHRARGRPGSSHSQDSWGSRGTRDRPPITTATQVPPPPSPKPFSPSQPLSREDDPTSSQFGNAIRLAAIAREKRALEEVAKPKTPVSKLEVKSTSCASPATAPTNIPPPPPGAPPPPPPPSMPPPEFTPKASPVLTPKSPPPHVKKQLEETRKREESHAALLAAVAKRRNIVDGGNQSELADSIEKRFNKDRKLQTTVYKSDQTREEVKNAPSPGALLSTPKREPVKVAEVKTPQSITPITPKPAAKVETRPSPVKKSPPPPPPATKPSNGQAVAVSNGTVDTPQRGSVG